MPPHLDFFLFIILNLLATCTKLVLDGFEQLIKLLLAMSPVVKSRQHQILSLKNFGNAVNRTQGSWDQEQVS
jgi:hypothetical protein